MRIVALVACGAFMLPFALAQAPAAEPRRESLRGTALLDDGSPWPGARVLLLARQPGVRGLAEDRLEATADSRGRFGADLRVGWRYSVFAHEALANDTERVSAVVDEIDIGVPLELVAGAARQRPHLDLSGLAPWRKRGALTVHWVGSGDVPTLVERIVAGDGPVAMPPLPGLAAAVEVRCGEMPITDRLPIDLQQATTPVTIHPPRDVALRIVDRLQQPVANARVSYYRREAARAECATVVPLAMSDQDGIARVVLPFPPDGIDQQFAPLAVDAPGVSPIGTIFGFRVPASHEPTPEHAFRVWCNDGRRHTVVLQRDGSPLVGIELDVAAQRAFGGVQGAAAGGTQGRELMVTDTTGAAAVDCVPGSPILVTAATAALGGTVAVAGPLAPLALLANIDPNDPVQRHVVDQHDLQPIQVRVTAPDGAPASGATVSLLVHGANWRVALPRASTDRAGRITFLVPRGVDCWLCAWNAQSSAAPAEPVRGGDALHPLRLEACATALLTITDAGAPVPLGKAIFGVLAMDHVQDAQLAAAVAPLFVTVDRRGTGRLPLYAGLSYSLGRVRTAAGWATTMANIDIPRDDPTALPQQVDLSVIPMPR